jgi:hypothetical protein
MLSAYELLSRVNLQVKKETTHPREKVMMMFSLSL